MDIFLGNSRKRRGRSFLGEFFFPTKGMVSRMVEQLFFRDDAGAQTSCSADGRRLGRSFFICFLLLPVVLSFSYFFRSLTPPPQAEGVYPPRRISPHPFSPCRSLQERPLCVRKRLVVLVLSPLVQTCDRREEYKHPGAVKTRALASG